VLSADDPDSDFEKKSRRKKTVRIARLHEKVAKMTRLELATPSVTALIHAFKYRSGDSILFPYPLRY